MKIFFFGVLAFFLATQEASNAAVVRKPPAFAKPVFSNSYLPASMQVIFHAVSQLKSLESDESGRSTTSSTKTTVAATSPHPPGQHQPIFQKPTDSSIADIEVSGEPEVTAVNPSSSVPTDENNASTMASITSSSIIEIEANRSTFDAKNSTNLKYNEESMDNVDPETPEVIYATPEVNHEIEETVHVTAETNHETTRNTITSKYTVYNLSEKNRSEENSSEESEEKNYSSEETEVGRTDIESSEESKQDERDSAEEEDDEIRFTLIGEKVAQVPRPSLSNYLRKTGKAPLRSTTQELAGLYDALSKDARKQGFAKYSGFSDEVLKILESSAEGGIGSQMRILLEKTRDRMELTRDDAKTKISSTIRKLNDPGSILNRDLRPLIPLRYVP